MVKFLNAGLVYKSLVSKFSSKTKPIYYMPPNILEKAIQNSGFWALAGRMSLLFTRSECAKNYKPKSNSYTCDISRKKKLLANTYCVVKKKSTNPKHTYTWQMPSVTLLDTTTSAKPFTPSSRRDARRLFLAAWDSADILEKSPSRQLNAMVRPMGK